MASGDHYICNGCGYEWRTRKDVGSPHQCPRCGRGSIELEKDRRIRIHREIMEKREIEKERIKREKELEEKRKKREKERKKREKEREKEKEKIKKYLMNEKSIKNKIIVKYHILIDAIMALLILITFGLFITVLVTINQGIFTTTLFVLVIFIIFLTLSIIFFKLSNKATNIISKF